MKVVKDKVLSLYKCLACRAVFVEKANTRCPNSGDREHVWTKPKEREYKPRIKHFKIKTEDLREQTIARWDKKRGLLWRVAPHKYGVDRVDGEFSNYWKVTEGSNAGILAAIQQVGYYLHDKMINEDDAHELLDLLNRALAANIDV